MFVCQVIQCTEEMTKQTLWDAMHTEQPNVEAFKVMTFANINNFSRSLRLQVTNHSCFQNYRLTVLPKASQSLLS
jgi:hypothetical protein